MTDIDAPKGKGKCASPYTTRTLDDPGVTTKTQQAPIAATRDRGRRGNIQEGGHVATTARYYERLVRRSCPAHMSRPRLLHDLRAGPGPRHRDGAPRAPSPPGGSKADSR